MGKFGIGQSVRREEDPRLLTGRGLYVNDVNLPGQSYAIFLRSPHAHAEIKSIDAAAAKAAPGVLAVSSTGEDVAADGLGYPGMPAKWKRPDGAPMKYRPQPPLALRPCALCRRPGGDGGRGNAASGARRRRTGRRGLRHPAHRSRTPPRPWIADARGDLGRRPRTTSSGCSSRGMQRPPKPRSPGRPM